MRRPLLQLFSLLGWLVILGYLTALQRVPAPPSTEQAPRIELSPSSLDLGEVQAYTQRSFTVKVFNRGNGPLKLFDVGVSCGCLHVQRDGEIVVPPHDSWNAVGTFDSSGFFGQLVKELTFKTNDPARPELRLYVRSWVIPLLEGPPALVVPGLKPDQELSAGLDLRPGTPRRPLSLGAIVSGVSAVRLARRTALPEGGVHLDCVVRTREAVEGSLQVEVLSPVKTTLEVPVRLEMAP